MALSYTYEEKFLENHLIAYIGNKRRLLPLLIKAIREVEERGSVPVKRNGLFIDFFAGTGVVSRLAKSLGFGVVSNDWEKYSYIINKVFVEGTESDLQLFDEEGGIEEVINELNRKDSYKKKDSYIAEYYCPANDDTPDTEHERMFYTRQNGIIIDNIRAEIDRKYPFGNDEKIQKKRNILLSLLLYEASTRSNTNGVFKAFHNGFGGRHHDALSRIMKKVMLKKPVLSKKTNKCTVYNSDAVELSGTLKNKKAEIVYLDPPYNQHQYGSNYHLLNTILLNDKPEINKEFIIDGKKCNKSAIRKDWVQTKSPFCYKQSALDNFQTLISNINAKYILVSYSTEGIIDFDKMLSVLSGKGRVGIVTTGYVRYRGGRQANTTKNKNIEFILIVDTAKACRERDITNVKNIILTNSLGNLLEQTFPVNIERPGVAISLENGVFVVNIKNAGFSFSLNRHLNITQDFYDQYDHLSYEKKYSLYKELTSVFSYTNDEEIQMIMDLFNYTSADVDRKYFLSRLITLYNKINPKKTPDIYLRLTSDIFEFFEHLSLPEKELSSFKRLKKIHAVKKNIQTQAA
jgi:adenine-specific DNA-methyltransferase